MNFLAIAIPGVIAALAIFMVNSKPLLPHKRHQLLTLKHAYSVELNVPRTGASF